MHILHISNSYGGTSVYRNLYNELDKLGVRQTVFVPLNANNHKRIGNQMIDFQTDGSSIIYSTALKKYHRFLYKAKIKCAVKEILSRVNINDINLIHASTQCVDGAIAYELNKRYGIPYIVAVRNTDVNNYYKVFVWRKPYFSQILEEANKIIFISPKYRENFVANTIPCSVATRISEKIEVIPNGVGGDFLAHQQKTPRTLKTPVRVAFISSFKRGKGLLELIDAIGVLRNKGIEIQFRAIGRGLPNRGDDPAYLAAVEKKALGKQWLSLEDFKAPVELREVLRQTDIFAMPSAPETFGLVYVEALSQNVPILYAQNQGFDGFYPDGFVGYPAKAGNVDDIADKLKRIIDNYAKMSENISRIDLNSIFDWARIAEQYLRIYQNAEK